MPSTGSIGTLRGRTGGAPAPLEPPQHPRGQRPAPRAGPSGSAPADPPPGVRGSCGHRLLLSSRPGARVAAVGRPRAPREDGVRLPPGRARPGQGAPRGWGSPPPGPGPPWGRPRIPARLPHPRRRGGRRRARGRARGGGGRAGARRPPQRPFSAAGRGRAAGRCGTSGRRCRTWRGRSSSGSTSTATTPTPPRPRRFCWPSAPR